MRRVWILCFLMSFPTRAQTEPHLFDGLAENTVQSFSGDNLFYHLSAFAVTPLLIRSGADAQTFATFRSSPNHLALPGAIAGSGAGALVAGLWLYRNGISNHDSESLGAAYVVAQASAITVAYVTFLKSFTGRAHPTITSADSEQKQSESFNFAFNNLGIGYGWPSGHVSHTVAVTTALATYYPEKVWLRTLSFTLSAYMLYTASAFHSGQMHWFSDGVAGAFIGYAVGTTVGKNFRVRVRSDARSTARLHWFPLIDANFIGAVGTVAF